MLYAFAGLSRYGDIRSFLEEFCKSKGLTLCMEELDISRGAAHDLLDDRIFEQCRKRVPRLDIVIVTPSCSTFTRAVWANTAGPTPLRSADYPSGFPWLEGEQLRKAQDGNQLLERGLQLIYDAIDHHVRHLFEFPEDLGRRRDGGGTPASPFRAAELRAKIDKSTSETAGVFRCRWPDEPNRKPLRFISDVPGIIAFGKKGWPRFDAGGYYIGPLPRDCGHSHKPLIGQLPGGAFATSGSGSFSPSMCRDLARELFDGFDYGEHSSGASGSSPPEGGAARLRSATQAQAGRLEPSVRLLGKAGAAPMLRDLVETIFVPFGKRSAVPGRSVCAGLSAFAGTSTLATVPVVNGFTKDHTRWLQRLNRAVQQDAAFPADFLYTSVQINDDTQPYPHEDANNRGHSIAISLGSFSGGELAILIDGKWSHFSTRNAYLFFRWEPDS